MLNTPLSRRYVLLLVITVLFFAGCKNSDLEGPASRLKGDASGLIPLDSRWEHPQYLTFRPGHALIAKVNPPRMSWPYLPHVEIASSEIREGLTDGEGTIPFRSFRLQISSHSNFLDPEVKVDTEYNFYNALKPLKPGRWHWRVKYEREGDRHDQWSSVRTFVIEPDTPEWDRSGILTAAERLGAQGHPRMGPPDGNWKSWRTKLESNEQTAGWLDAILRRADAATRRGWWKDFPETDKGDGAPSIVDWGQEIGPGLVNAALAYRLTGDEKYAVVEEHFLQLASFPRGGNASPEYFVKGPKWGTRITLHLALFYDWWHDELSEPERRKVVDAIDWRLEAILFGKYSWRGQHGVWRSGVSVFAQSHPFENFLWATQAVLLTAGESPVADSVLEPTLHWLTGVTTPFGPDEGWNEGLAYGTWKIGHPLAASLQVARVLPDLQIQRNPVFVSHGQWFRHMLPIGIDRSPFGDSSAPPSMGRFTRVQKDVFRRLAWLTRDPAFTTRHLTLKDKHKDDHVSSIWLDMLVKPLFELPPTGKEPSTAHFPTAGWVMAASHSPSDTVGFENGMGMIFQSRPTGGFSHSYRAENTFAWYALGQTLSAPGGSVLFRDPYARHTMSHNGILIDGQGQEWDESHYHARYPFAGRLLAFEEGDGYVHWVGDATYAYQTVEGLLRAQRHVVFVANQWFAIYDDLAMRPGAEPAKFTYLFHVAKDVPGTLDAGTGTFDYQVADVHARLSLGNDPSTLSMINQKGRDGFRNPVTGEDLYDKTLKIQSRWDRPAFGMSHNIWATTREPVHEWQFLSALTAWRDGAEPIKLEFPSNKRIVATYPDGRKRSVSFDSKGNADINIDVSRIRDHAQKTDPNQLAATGEHESVVIGEDQYEVEWLHNESFGGTWMMRWIAEGDALVYAENGALHQRKTDQGVQVKSTLWFRPELPQNVVVRARVTVDKPFENNAGNINLILHARERDGGPLQFGRDGNYSTYHKIPNYIITLTGGSMEDDRGHNRLRRNPGFNLLVDNQEVRSHPGETYDLMVTIIEGRIRYYINGEKKIDYTDEDPLPAGRLGLRTWNSNVIWDQLEIGRLEVETTKNVRPVNNEISD